MKVALGVTGCIGAYKAVEVLRGLQQQGASVQVVMTRHAAEFVTPLTFQSISALPVITGMFSPSDDPEIKHIQIGQSIDLLLVAPATANILAKFAQGIADDFLSTLYISTTAPVLVAPAMNSEMWRHPATRANVDRLRERGVHFVDPGEGYLACKTVGPGRLAEPADIVLRAMDLLRRSHTGDLIGEHVLVTAGPTYEAIDPVRGITNKSSGRMGYAIAEAAVARGATVTLVTGPVSLEPPAGTTVIRVVSAAEMYAAVMDRFDDATMIVMAAAVADYRPSRAAETKIKKSDGGLVLDLERTEDILEAVARRKASSASDYCDKVIVGFAAETDDVLANAGKKLTEKKVDLIVANDVSLPGSGFDVETNKVWLVSEDDVEELPLLTKREVAGRVLDSAATLRLRTHT